MASGRGDKESPKKGDLVNVFFNLTDENRKAFEYFRDEVIRSALAEPEENGPMDTSQSSRHSIQELLRNSCNSSSRNADVIAPIPTYAPTFNPFHMALCQTLAASANALFLSSSPFSSNNVLPMLPTALPQSNPLIDQTVFLQLLQSLLNNQKN